MIEQPVSCIHATIPYACTHNFATLDHVPPPVLLLHRAINICTLAVYFTWLILLGGGGKLKELLPHVKGSYKVARQLKMLRAPDTLWTLPFILAWRLVMVHGKSIVRNTQGGATCAEDHMGDTRHPLVKLCLQGPRFPTRAPYLQKLSLE